MKARIDAADWSDFVERLGEVLENTFEDDVIRGLVFTDGLIGTFRRRTPCIKTFAFSIT